MESDHAFDEGLAVFAEELRRLRIERGNRSYRDLADRAERTGTGIRLPVTTQSDAFRGKRLLGFDTLMALVRILYSYDEYGQECAVPSHTSPQLEPWRQRWRELAALRSTTATGRARIPTPAPVPTPEHVPTPLPVPTPGPAASSAEGSHRRWSSSADEALFAAVHRLVGHNDAVWCVAFSPGARLLASADDAGSVRLWDTGTGVGLPGRISGTFPLAFTRDGRLLAADYKDGSVVRQFSVPDLSQAGPPLSGGTAEVRAMTYDADGDRLATLDFDGMVRLLDPASGRRLGPPLPDHSGHEIRSVAFTDDGRLLGTGRGRMWDVLRDRRHPGELLPSAVKSGLPTALSPDGRLLAFGRADGTAGLVGFGPDHRTALTLEGHTAMVTAMAFSPDGRLLASASEDMSVRLWDTLTGLPAGPPLIEHERAVTGLAFSRDGRLLATAAADGTVWVYERRFPSRTAPLGERALATALRARHAIQLPAVSTGAGLVRVAFSPDSQVLAATTSEGVLLFRDPITGQALGTPFGDLPMIPRALAFSPHGAVLATASTDRSVCLRDSVTGKLLEEVPSGHSGAVNDLVFSPDGLLLAIASADAGVWLWNRVTGGSTGLTLNGHSGEVVGLAFSPKGLLATSGTDGKVALWEIPTGRLAREFAVRTGSVRAVAFSAAGDLLAAGADGAVRLWDPATETPVGALRTGHAAKINDIAFSPDGALMASADGDGAVLLWDRATGGLVGSPLTGRDGHVHSVAFSTDGSLLAAAGRDGVLRRWIVGPL
ncbi:WD40 repeat domain-containing protein [Streptomyces sp. TBY4]|uniref:WD40 repeat domain-containing protein n=1 Tax=Streptomyces sp. TBY4 TaxID=2962030 RepID=UPI0020B857FD|nr:WD40 repeat domain-containing protein [Streptomyces sp. TBY4]MCP3754293.1 WD40 repeat domain-containing protein [Streptomyces sp. TBY4]